MRARTSNYTAILVALCLAATSAFAATITMKLSEVMPGSETVNLVANGNFEDNSSGNDHTPTGWARAGNMFYVAAPGGVTVPATTGSRLAKIHMDGGGLGIYQQTLALSPDTDYVLSGYLWHLGDGTHLGTVEMDLNDAPGEPAIGLDQGSADANQGYFMYDTFSTTATGTSPTLRLFMVVPTTSGWPNQPVGALWDNIAVTPASSFVAPVSAGTYKYVQRFDWYAQGTTELADGSVMSQTPAGGVVGAYDGSLRMSQNGVGSVTTSFRLPDLDPDYSLQSFTVTFDVTFTSMDADGFSFNFGNLDSSLGDGQGELGMGFNSTYQGLSVGWDTFDSGGDPRSIEVFANGVSVLNNTLVPPVDTVTQAVVIHWDGLLDVSYGGAAVCTDLAIPGYSPSIGDRCAWSARTGGLDHECRLDNMAVTTVPATKGTVVIIR